MTRRRLWRPLSLAALALAALTGCDLGAAARTTRVRDLADAVKTELYAQRGAAGCLASFTINVEGPTHFDGTGAKAGTSKILLIIKWRA